MKLYLHCLKCYDEAFQQLMSESETGNKATNIGLSPLVAHAVEVRDSSRYTVDCDQHGTHNVLVYTPLFEILFHIGLSALIDGYYREAVVSFASSLERFQEYYLKVISENSQMPKPTFQKVWGKIENRSERQLGAYLMTHFFMDGDLPPTLSEPKIKFRNDVVHKGTIPTRERAIDFGDAIFAVIRPVLSKIRQNHSEAIERIDQKRFNELKKDIQNRDSLLVKQSVHIVFGPSSQAQVPNEKISTKIETLTSWRRSISVAA